MMVKLLPLLYKMSGHLVYAIVGLSLVVGVDFQNKITLGSVMVAFVLIVIAGIFTIRSKIATIWREEAEGERAAKERCQDELAEERERRAVFEKEQQELRHQLKNEIVGLQATIKVLEAKTDLTALGEFMREQVGRSEKRDDQTHKLLEEIRDKLPSEPIRVQAHDVIPVHETERRKS